MGARALSRPTGHEAAHTRPSAPWTGPALQVRALDPEFVQMYQSFVRGPREASNFARYLQVYLPLAHPTRAAPS